MRNVTQNKKISSMANQKVGMEYRTSDPDSSPVSSLLPRFCAQMTPMRSPSRMATTSAQSSRITVLGSRPAMMVSTSELPSYV